MLRELNINELEEVSGGGAPLAPYAALAAWVGGGAAVGTGGSSFGFLLGTTFAHISSAGNGRPNIGAAITTVRNGALGGAVTGPHPGTLFGTAAVGFAMGSTSYQHGGGSASGGGGYQATRIPQRAD